MVDAIFIPSDDGRFEPSEHARGPWHPGALHGGAPAALIAQAFERMEPDSQLPIARLSFEFLSPIPFSPLALSTKIVRSGRRVQELAAELTIGEELLCRASGLRIQAVPEGLPKSGPAPVEPLPGPEQGKVLPFALNDWSATSLATTGMSMSWLEDPWTLGPGKVWMRLRHPLLPDDPATPLARLVAAADFANGVSSELPFEEYLFINADLTIHLWRKPEGEWIGLDAHTLLPDGGIGVAESVLHDVSGPVGRSFQTLVVQPR
jgi:Thioesterase-like superfamily